MTALPCPRSGMSAQQVNVSHWVQPNVHRSKATLRDGSRLSRMSSVYDRRHAPWHDGSFAREMVAVMTVGAPGSEVLLETSRLLLRPWRVDEAVVQRELWTERDPRVPPHRRIDADGHPTVAELEDSIRTNKVWSTGLLAVERKSSRDVIGYCGLVDSGRGSVGEPELAFELLRRIWRQGYATEASLAVLEWARSSGYERLWATVWDWNTASRRVLAKVGFTETDRKEVDAVHGTTLFTTRRL